LRGLLKRGQQQILDWIWGHDAGSGGIFSRTARAAARIAHIVLREFGADAITLRASALTYTIVLSMVPVLAMGTAILKGLGGGDQMRQAAYGLIDRLEETSRGTGGTGLPRDELFESHLGGRDATEEPQTASDPQNQDVQTLTTHLRTAVDTVFEYVEKTNFATLGAFGIVGLLVTVVTALGTIEHAMNVIWQAESDRPLGRKVMDYLALMILLPITVNVGIAATAALQNNTLLLKIQQFFPAEWAGPLLVNLLTITLVVAAFVTLYRFLPNVRVGFGPALAGGIAGGLAWLFLQALYIRLQIGVARYNAIYGSFATLPLLLLWIYMSWLVFLSGAEVAFAVHVWRRYDPGLGHLTPSRRLALAFDILTLAFSDFDQRKVTERDGLVRRTGARESHVAGVIQDLADAGLLRPVEGEPEAYVPGTAARHIPAGELVDIIWGTDIPPSQGGRTALESLAAARRALENRTLLRLVEADAPASERPHPAT